jgi:hypothetical protein
LISFMRLSDIVYCCRCLVAIIVERTGSPARHAYETKAKLVIVSHMSMLIWLNDLRGKVVSSFSSSNLGFEAAQLSSWYYSSTRHDFLPSNVQFAITWMPSCIISHPMHVPFGFSLTVRQHDSRDLLSDLCTSNVPHFLVR